MQKVEFRLALCANPRILSVCGSVEHLLGYPPADLVREDFELPELFYPADAQRLTELVEQDRPAAALLRLRGRDGKVRCVHALARRDAGQDGEPQVRLTLRAAASAPFSPRQFRAVCGIPAVIECVDEAIHFKDTRHVIRLANRNFRQMFSDGSGALRELTGLTDYDLFDPASADPLYALEEEVLAGSPLAHLVQESVDRSGQRAWHDVRKSPVRDARGRLIGILTVVSPVTGLQQNEERLKLAASVFSHASEGILIADAEGNVLDVNTAFTRITGYAREEVLGLNPRFLKSGRQSPEFYKEMWNRLLSTGHWSGEMWNRARDGQVYPEMLTINAIHDATGKPRNYVALFSDMTSFKQQEQQLELIANYDLLTGLPNRVLVNDRLKQAMAHAQRYGRCLAVACLDLDNFRAINDRCGRQAGDEVLKTITRRMDLAMREGDTLARLGGDELVAVLLDLPRGEDCLPLIERLLRAASEPVQLGEETLSTSASIGITLYPQPEDVDAEQLLRQANQAMYVAKLEGKARYHLFDPGHDRTVRGRHEDLERFAQAIRNNELVLHFQPKVNMNTGALLGAEALVRWQHPERGLLMPGEFLPMLKGHPLLIEMGRWVLRGALRQLEEWLAAGLDLSVSVNVDATQLQQPDVVDRLRARMAEFPAVPPSRVEFEVLESADLDDVGHVSQVLHAGSRLGVRFALDDFGTGYSSLAYLKRLPVHSLKIDQSFVRGMLDDPEDLTLVEGILGLANAFRRQPVAEGVETVEHGLMLLRLGCTVGQGYAIARPMPGGELPGWAARWRPDPRWTRVSAVDPHHWPVLHASAEHRAWVSGIEDYLHGRRNTPPPVEHQLCRFGAWLDTQSFSNHGTQPVVQSIDALHHRLHALANGVVGLKSEDRTESAEAALPGLYTLRDALIEEIGGFVEML